MRLLDRYLILSFLRNLLIGFCVMIGLYVTLDMTLNFDELLSVQTQAGLTGLRSVVGIIQDAGAFYFYQSFRYYILLSGIIPVVAGVFTLARMSRFGEMTAILSAGVPVTRLAAPIVLTGMALNVFLIVDQEVLIPRMIPQLLRGHGDARNPDGRGFSLPLLCDRQGNLLSAGWFEGSGLVGGRLKRVCLLERDSQGRPTALTQAKEATWHEESQAWLLEEGWTRELQAQAGQPATRPARAFLSDLSPKSIRLSRSRNHLELLPVSKINELLAQENQYSRADLLRVKHVRFAQPILNVVILLLAVACVLGRDPSTLKVGLTRCFILVGLCLGMAFFGYQLGGQPPTQAGWTHLWPALSAWAPIFIFGPIAVYLLDRVES